ncbi:TRAP transporter substrate-binding protein [Propionivibrio limicola]|uniref:TRAP transporter substrate-binding protein n=1 Tax=Propionivibrio limicola TaxID=167645 RepID=UPI001290F709|nr:TRAP transporter substrate-binding protein [Propionivibrio limicola]
MERRSFLKSAGVGLAAGAAAMPAIAQNSSLPVIKWRMASSFPKSLDTLFGTGEFLIKRLSEITGGKFQIQHFAAGEIVPGPGVHDAVRDNTVELGHTCGYYYYGKDPTYCIDTAIPFGMNNRQTDAWYREGNGSKLMNEFFAKSNIIAFPCGNTGVQMGGWFRKEIKSAADLKGLKMRIAGLAGAVLSKVGVVPQQIAGPDIYPSLEKGTIDAAEWVGPYDDHKLGFNKVAKYYYYPGWWEGGPQVSVYVNTKKWASLPKEYQAAFRAACADAHTEMRTKYDAKNPEALKKLVAAGAQLRPFPKDVMEVCYKAAMELYAEISAKNPNFKRVYDDYKKFMDDQNAWFRVAEGSYANFMFSRRK